ncbi:MAG: PD40 domain-containing protein [Planctomycetaceae bacterium]|nr:PD40 domain-containing protein [Planctomycetaceae bacterium]
MLKSVGFIIFNTVLVLSLNLSPLSADEKAAGVKRVRFYAAPTEGGQAQLFLVPGEYYTAGSPTLSSLSQKLAFDGRKSQDGEKFADGKIMVVNADGTNLEAVGSGVMPSWSPQGNRIAFSHLSPSGVAIMHADGTHLEMIEEGGWGAQWSPDGKKIAYTVRSGNRANIRVYDLVEGTKTNLLSEGESPYSTIYWNMAWSPDSNWVCFKGRNVDQGTYEIATLNVAGKQQGYKVHYSNKTAPYADIAWHPSGEKIVFAAGSQPRQLMQFNPAEDKPPAPIDIKVNGTIIGDVCFTPDGQSLLFNVSGTEE